MPGAGAFEVAAHCMLKKEIYNVKGRVKLGIQVLFLNLLISYTLQKSSTYKI